MRMRRVTGVATYCAVLIGLVACGASTTDTAAELGAIRIVTATAGVGIDSGGYAFRIDAGPTHPIAVTDTQTVTGFASGPHVIQFRDIASNCHALGPSLLTVTVTRGDTVTASLSVSCVAPEPGVLQVSTVTAGLDQDPDGYVVHVDGDSGHPIATNGTLTLDSLEAGKHVLELTGLADNCVPVGDTGRTVTIGLSASTDVLFQVRCKSLDWIAFLSDVEVEGQNDIYMMRLDSTERIKLTATGGYKGDLSWSPDGNRIAFTGQYAGDSSPGIYVLDVETGASTKLTPDSERDGHPAWSPDGTFIAYASGPLDALTHVWLMRADGTGRRDLTPNGDGDEPTWSPDGTKIAFTSARDQPQGFALWTMNADGSDPIRITPLGGVVWQPAWSPDGNWIAFSALEGTQEAIFMVHPDGSGLMPFHAASAPAGDVSWSLDGQRLVYMWTNAVAMVNVDGTGLAIWQQDLAPDWRVNMSSPRWRPRPR